MKTLTPTIFGLLIVLIFFSCKTKENKKSASEAIPVVSNIANKPITYLQPITTVPLLELKEEAFYGQVMIGENLKLVILN